MTSGEALPVRLRYAYIDTVHRIFGDDHPFGEFDGDSHLAEAAVDTPLGQAALFTLMLDFDNAPRLSSQTWGARLTGSREALSWRIEYARQSDHAGNGSDFDVDYVRAEADYAFSRASLSGGIEILGPVFDWRLTLQLWVLDFFYFLGLHRLEIEHIFEVLEVFFLPVVWMHVHLGVGFPFL